MSLRICRTTGPVSSPGGTDARATRQSHSYIHLPTWKRRPSLRRSPSPAYRTKSPRPIPLAFSSLPPPVKTTVEELAPKDDVTVSEEELVRPVTVREASDAAELRAAARLRAEAYYEDQRSRYVETFKAAFAREEAKSLLARTAQKANGCAECVCLVAVERGRDNLVGTLDVRAPASSSESVTVDANGRYPNGVPEGHPDAVYVLNVCVSEDHRGCGIGTLLMLKACEDAHTRWGSKLVYTEVDTWNDAAYGLYLKLGFARVGGGGKEAPGSRDRLLLFAELPLQIHASKNIADTSATSL